MNKPKAGKAADFYVVTVETAKDRLVKRMGPIATRRAAERIEAGVERNLNHERFHVEVVDGNHPLATAEVVA